MNDAQFSPAAAGAPRVVIVGSGGHRAEVSLPTGETWAEHAPRLVLAFQDAPTVTA